MSNSDNVRDSAAMLWRLAMPRTDVIPLASLRPVGCVAWFMPGIDKNRHLRCIRIPCVAFTNIAGSERATQVVRARRMTSGCFRSVSARLPAASQLSQIDDRTGVLRFPTPIPNSSMGDIVDTTECRSLNSPDGEWVGTNLGPLTFESERRVRIGYCALNKGRNGHSGNRGQYDGRRQAGADE